MKNVFFILLLVLGTSASYAQEVYNSSGKANYKNKKKDKGYDPDKLILGGGMNLGIGGGFANVGISPIVGYRLTKFFSAGVGLGYQYYREPDIVDNKYFSSWNIFYPNIWTRIFVYRNVFLGLSYEYHFIKVKNPRDQFANLNETRFNITDQCLLVSLGMRQPIAGRLSFYGELFYDVLQGKYSPYPKGSPGLRFGVAAGL